MPVKGTVLRILQIVNSIKGGGAEKLVCDLHQRYLAMGHESAVIALSGPAEGEFFHSAGCSSPYSPLAAFRASRLFRNVLPRADVVHVHLFPALLAVPGALRRAGFRGPLFATEHSTSNRRRGTLRGRVLDRYTYGRYSRIICISEAVEHNLVSWKPSVKGRTTVIHNGIPLERFVSVERASFHDPAVILSVGRITEAKNLLRALEAIEILSRTSPVPFVWKVAGDGPLLSRLKERAEDLVSADFVRILGNRDDVPELMRDADILFMPSLWEGFGIAAVEAMASGLPVVAGDVPGLRSVVGQDTGLLVDPMCEGSQAGALAELLVDPCKAVGMGNEGMKRARCYSIEKCADEHLELFREAL